VECPDPGRNQERCADGSDKRAARAVEKRLFLFAAQAGRVRSRFGRATQTRTTGDCPAERERFHTGRGKVDLGPVQISKTTSSGPGTAPGSSSRRATPRDFRSIQNALISGFEREAQIARRIRRRQAGPIEQGAVIWSGEIVDQPHAWRITAPSRGPERDAPSP